jgi:Ca2+-binding RTX toxin-like protein
MGGRNGSGGGLKVGGITIKGDGHGGVAITSLYGNNTITVKGSNATVTTGDGNDKITTYDGKDNISSGGGDDIINTGGNDDTVDAGAGADCIIGGLGADQLTGGLGADLFKYLTVNDSPTGVGTADRIIDFVPGTDKIDLSAIDAKPTDVGDTAFFFEGETNVGQLYRVNWYKDIPNNQTIIEADNNGVAGADITIILSGLLDLTAADFIL